MLLACGAMVSPRVQFPSRLALANVVLVVLAACGGSNRGPSEAIGGGSTNAAAGTRIETLSQVDVSELTSAEQDLWVDLINDQLSPCGEPISVAKCVSTQHKCSACVTAARYLVRLVMEGYDRATLVDHYRGRFDKAPAAQLTLDDAPVRGAAMAKVTIVEFSDFQCPHCAAAHPELQRLLRELDGSVRLVYKYFPLSGHPAAVPAARAAEAARMQGKFWPMHDLLFEHQDALEEEHLARYAQEIGLDLPRFHADVASDAVQARVAASKAQGEKLRVGATPAFFVNGRQFRESSRSLLAYVREELDR